MDGVLVIGKSRQMSPRQFQNIILSNLVTFSHMEISNIYTKEGSVNLIEIDRRGWIKGGAILIRMDYIYEDECVSWAMEPLSRI